MQKITYKKAGVDIEGMDNFKRQIKPLVRKSFRSEVLKDIGGFGSFFKFSKEKYKDPVLVSSADGVGTKLKIAALANKHDTVGIDAVAMNVNDILCTGAEPLFFLDYIAFSKISSNVLFDIVKGINNGCVQAGCSLIGGETAQMPGMYKEGDYDIAGFCVGVAEKNKIIDGSQIMPGDAVIGLESSGLHSNGFSLVRKVFSESELRRMSAELLKPTRIYVKPVLSLLRNTSATKLRRTPANAVWRAQYLPAGQAGNTIKGIAHITGGAFYDKIARILPDNVNVRINKNSWVVPKIFQLIQNKGGIEDKEMYHTLNMGIGMVLIVEEKFSKVIMSELSRFKIKSWAIGETVKGRKQVDIE